MNTQEREYWLHGKAKEYSANRMDWYYLFTNGATPNLTGIDPNDPEALENLKQDLDDHDMDFRLEKITIH